VSAPARAAAPGRLWAVVLSGGEGRRLRPLVRQAIGEERPKQYVKLLATRSLLRQTLDRAALGVSPDRTVVVTVRSHAAHIAEEFAGAAEPPYVLAQPDDRGTAAGVLYPTHWILRRDPEATLLVLPSDHFVLGEATFMAHVKDVVRSVGRHHDRVALLGAPPTSVDRERGCIEVGAPLEDPDRGISPDRILSTVRGLWARPSEVRARAGLGAGALWNTGIVVARAAALAALGALALPEMTARLTRSGAATDREEEPAMVHQAYALMRAASFSRAVLEPHPEHLAVSQLPRVTWRDLDSPHQVMEVVARLRVRPAWAAAVAGPAPIGPAARTVPDASPAVSR
jgi:mannose-1-phosphate guanylyltransferase